MKPRQNKYFRCNKQNILRLNVMSGGLSKPAFQNSLISQTWRWKRSLTRKCWFIEAPEAAFSSRLFHWI